MHSYFVYFYVINYVIKTKTQAILRDFIKNPVL